MKYSGIPVEETLQYPDHFIRIYRRGDGLISRSYLTRVQTPVLLEEIQQMYGPGGFEIEMVGGGEERTTLGKWVVDLRPPEPAERLPIEAPGLEGPDPLEGKIDRLADLMEVQARALSKALEFITSSVPVPASTPAGAVSDGLMGIAMQQLGNQGERIVSVATETQKTTMALMTEMLKTLRLRDDYVDEPADDPGEDEPDPAPAGLDRLTIAELKANPGLLAQSPQELKDLFELIGMFKDLVGVGGSPGPGSEPDAPHNERQNVDTEGQQS